MKPEPNFPPFPFRAVLLDLDGTLLDTIPDLAAACNGMLSELRSQPLPVADIATYVGKGTEVLVKRCLLDPRVALPADDRATAQALTIFNRHYHRVNGRESRLYPGVQEGLAALREAGATLAVVTNKPTEFTLPLLERTGLAHWFSAIVCGDTCPRKKPDPMPLLHACELLGCEPQHALAIGDSINDALAARAAGITVLAVPYGYNEGLDIQSLDIDGIVSGIDHACVWASQRSQAQTVGNE